MLFIDWLFVIAMLILAAIFLFPDFANSMASVVQVFFGL